MVHPVQHHSVNCVWLESQTTLWERFSVYEGGGVCVVDPELCAGKVAHVAVSV